MPEPNKNHLSHMEYQGNKIDLEFSPNISLGCFSLSMREKDLLKIIKKFHGKYSITEEDNTVYYYCEFGKINISFFFHYNKRGFDYLSINTTSLELNGVALTNVKLSHFLKLMSKLHRQQNVKFQYSFEELDDEHFYDFINIGLSVWFESNKISDISINKIQ